MPAERSTKTRLATWKEVAAFFGKSERTVMRWEAERGLPVHRIPGDARSGIYADPSELEAWLCGPGRTIAAGATDAAAHTAEPIIEAPAPQIGVPGARLAPRASPWLTPAIAIGVAACAIVAILVARGLPHAPAPVPQAAQALYEAGMKNWAQRTPSALNRAVEEFTAAIRIDADYAEAYVGLANSYILLREFAVMPSAHAYSLAEAAAIRAIALKPGLAGAHAAYAFALVYGDWRFAKGLAEFERALQLEPNNPGLHHWYATALMAVGKHDLALNHIDRALALDRGAREVQADRALILASEGRYGEARVLLTQQAAESPDFLSPHAYLAFVALATGDDGAFLREEALRARLQHDTQGTAIVLAAQAGYESGGHAGMLQALIKARLAVLADGTGSASSVALAYVAAGDKKQTLAYLNRAIDRRDENAFAWVNDTLYGTVLGDAALAPLRARLDLQN